MFRCTLFRSILLCLLLPALLRAGDSPRPGPFPDPGTPVSLETALQRAIEQNPELKKYLFEREAAAARIEQAGLRPNPVVGAEMENFPGSGPYSGVDSLEFTLSLSQRIETAGKRSKRVQVARGDRALLEWKQQNRLADLEATVQEAFTQILLAEEELRLREEMLKLAKQSEEAISTLTAEARASAVELSRAELETGRQLLSRQQAERAMDTAKARLATQWGLFPAPEFQVTGSLAIEPTVPRLQELLDLLPQTLALARYDSVRVYRESLLDLERAKGKPDIEVFAGGRYFNEAHGDVAFVVGVEIPWPLFDQNQGNIRAARSELRGISSAEESERYQLSQELTEAYHQLISARADAETVQLELLPAAEKTLTDTETGFQRGQFSLLAVLESRQTLHALRELHLDALRRHTAAQIAIHRLTFPAAS